MSSQSNFKHFRIYLAFALFLSCHAILQAQFTEGNILILRAGDGVSSLSSASAPVFIEEYTTSGTLVQTIALPTSGTNQVSLSGINPDGILFRTSDNKRVVFGGYDAPPAVNSISTSSSVTAKRIVGSLNVTGNYTRAVTVNTSFSGVPIRSVCSEGSNFWGCSTGFLATGVIHLTTSSAQQICSSPTNLNCVREFNNQLYAATPNSPYYIYSIGSGLPTTSGQTASLFINPTGVGSGNPQVSDFVINPTSTICYIADTRTVSGGGIQRWSYNGSAWVHDYTLSTGTSSGARTLTVDFSGINPVIHAIAFDGITSRYIQITDTGSASTYTDLFTASANTILKGIAFAPICTYGCTNSLACNYDPDATCDDNSCTGEWWYADNDADLAYDANNSILSCLSPGTNYISATTIANLLLEEDCDDTNDQIHPQHVEICGNNMDDNCDGLIDNECAGSSQNDFFGGAANVAISGSAYPAGNCFTGSLAGATASPQGLVASVASNGGADRWYRFTTLSSAARITCTTSSMDVVLELHSLDGSFITSENANSNIGNETWLLTNLTPGTSYALAVRCYDSNPGAYSLCIQNFAYSTCADGSGVYDLCSNFKPAWTGATNYTFTFTPVGGTPGNVTSSTNTSQIPLSNVNLGLRHDGEYEVVITANYTIAGFGTLSLPSPDVCSIQIAPHADLQVKSNQRCSNAASLLPGTRMQAKPFVCGAIGYEVEFQEVTDCSGASIIGPAFVKNIASASAQLQLNFSTPQALQAGSFYAVRWKPLFIYGPGDFGTVQVIQMSSPSTQNMEVLETNFTTNSADEIILYPNPTHDRRVNLWSETPFEGMLDVQIFSSTGLLVQQMVINTEGQNLIQIALYENLATGLYVLRYTNGTHNKSSALLLD